MNIEEEEDYNEEVKDNKEWKPNPFELAEETKSLTYARPSSEDTDIS